MDACYKDILLSYRKEIKPLVARIESLKTRIPEQLVPDTAIAFENIALAASPEATQDKRKSYLDKAQAAIMHCKSGCYQQLINILQMRIGQFEKRASRRFLLSMDDGKTLGRFKQEIKESKDILSKCKLHGQVTREHEIADLQRYQQAYWKLLRPYIIVRKNEQRLVIERSTVMPQLSKNVKLWIAIACGIAVTLGFELISYFISKL